MKRLALLLVTWLTVAGLSHHLSARHASMQPVKPVFRYQDLLLDLLGEGRTLLARWLWFKVDLTHEDEDVRGVDTFQQKELIPMLRMITYLDPYFVDAYDLIAFDLHKGYAQTRLAAELVEEGLRFNPDSYVLNFRRAFLAVELKDADNGLKYAKKAYFAADNEPNATEMNYRLNSLRLMYSCALLRDDAKLGVVVVEHILANGGRVPNIAQMIRWRERLQAQSAPR